MDFGSECFIVETVTDCDAVTDESVLYHPFQTFHPEPSNYGLTIHENSFTPALSDNLQFDDVNSGKKLIHTGLLLQGMAKKVKHVFSFPSIVTSQQSNDYRPTTPRNSPALSDNLQFDDVNSDLQQQEECELDDLYDFRYLKRAVEISLRRLERAAASRSREEFRLALPLFTDRVMLLVRHCVEDIDNNVAETPRL
ncbi:uncharacterized protein LOC125782624 isoform X2 [Astyanax mexicanus]|uniref:uncharacterized protein LOC125782618 isoform X2 n=1 Tax=Astyanax mexicanus TaxID=7994 RepID=UPI0020CB29C2|nr:uncharacterized protein LOC125782618 isoform X2 [Astyanax mexicanus]XP_049323227.1 uncharacterized protein LOC125782624 isoform X2 [Astyanax mexicanus]